MPPNRGGRIAPRVPTFKKTDLNPVRTVDARRPTPVLEALGLPTPSTTAYPAQWTAARAAAVAAGPPAKTMGSISYWAQHPGLGAYSGLREAYDPYRPRGAGRYSPPVRAVGSSGLRTEAREGGVTRGDVYNMYGTVSGEGDWDSLMLEWGRLNAQGLEVTSGAPTGKGTGGGLGLAGWSQNRNQVAYNRERLRLGLIGKPPAGSTGGGGGEFDFGYGGGWDGGGGYGGGGSNPLAGALMMWRIGYE